MRDALGLAAANVCFLVAGIGLTRPLGFWRSPRDLPAVLGIAFMTGLAAVAVTATLLLIVGLALTIWEIVFVAAAFGATGFVRPPSEPSLGVPPGAGRAARWLTFVILSLLAAYLVALLYRSWHEPLRHWDAWANWTLRAQAIVLLDGLDERVFASDAYYGSHLEYPILVPALEAIDFRFMGGARTRAIDVQFWLVLVGFLAAAGQLLRDRVHLTLLAPGLVLLGSAPALAIQIRWGIADLPLALLFGLAVLAAWRYVESGLPAFAALAGIFGAAAASTKREGLAFVVILLVVLAVAAWLRRTAVRPVLVTAAIAALGVVPWRLWVNAHELTTLHAGELPLAKALTPGYLLDRADRVPVAVSGLVEEAFEPSWWQAVLPLFLVAALLAIRSGRGRPLALFLLSVLALMFAAAVWAYWADSPEIQQHVDHTARRVVTSMLVVCGLFLPLLAAALAERERPARVPP